MKCKIPFKWAINGTHVVTYSEGDEIEDPEAQEYAKANGYAEGGKRTTKKPRGASTRDKAGSGGERDKDED